MKLLTVLFCSLLLAACQTQSKKNSVTKSKIKSLKEQPLLGEMEVYIDHGKRAGEGYFSADGNEIVFQSELDTKNPFYQIFHKDLKSGKITQVSPGTGKTTCAWVMPNGGGYTFASTHEDPEALKKQEEEIELRKSPKKRRYSWDYDPSYEIYIADTGFKNLKKLTNAKGYDAEASASPDGKYIVFTSNRHAYSQKLSKSNQELLLKDPSYFLELYRMNADGSDVVRLTRSAGYDGGPFFSPDGQRIVWRRFTKDGRTAEVYTMDLNGKDVKKITSLKTMSWAPFYHPSGDYIVFTRPSGGHRNFELYIVDTEGKRDPIQVTYLDGFDGLPVFTPDGKYLTWNRPTADGRTQIFRAKWHHDKAREALGLNHRFPNGLSAEIKTDDLVSLVKYLSSEKMAGRMTGSQSEKIYTNAIAEKFKSWGLQDYQGKYIHEFRFPIASRLLSGNSLTLIGDQQVSFKIKKDWMPANTSKSGQVSASEVAFAGYGFYTDNYNSYRNADVKNKWVMLFEDLPNGMEKSKKLQLLPYASSEHKIKVAKEQGARGLIFIKSSDLMFNTEAAEAFDLPVVSISEKAAELILALDGYKLKDLRNNANKDPNTAAYNLKAKISASTNIDREYGTGRNVMGYLPGSTRNIVTIGGHGDHLGLGGSKSLKKSSDKSNIHFGADDNSSGVSAILEIAHALAAEKKAYRSGILFAIWSGEELGNLGSQAFLKKEKRRISRFKAYLNLDMVGRMTNKAQLRPLLVQGLGSGTQLKSIVERNRKNLSIKKLEDPYLPTDALSFYLKKVPVVSLFTGTHTDYHTPRDTYDKIDYPGLTRITLFSRDLITDFAENASTVRYQKVERKNQGNRFRFKIYLGTIPDYTYQGNGVRLSGVVKSSPAEVAGLKEGDIIVSYDGEAVKGMRDYMKSLQLSETNKSYIVQIQRAEKFLSLNVTPKSKDSQKK